MIDKLVSIKEEPVGNFRDQMLVVRLGLLHGKRWNLGRLRYLELGVWAPLSPVVLAVHETPGDNLLPMEKIDGHMTLRWGKLSLRLF